MIGIRDKQQMPDGSSTPKDAFGRQIHPGSGRRKVLIVDDEQSIRAAASRAIWMSKLNARWQSFWTVVRPSAIC